jgi:hypothetical protein
VAHTTAEQHETRYSPEVIEECESLARFIADGGALKQVDPIVYEDSQLSAGMGLSEKTKLIAHHSLR